MIMRRLVPMMSIVVATLLVEAAAHAGDPAAATILFNDAMALAAKGNFAAACPKFEESQRLDPGLGTQYNLAACYEHLGRVATAWALFLEVASGAQRAGQTAREREATGRATSLEPHLSRLRVSAPKDVLGLEVRRNGELLGGVLWGNAVPVDPGSYTIEATAPGRTKWSTVVGVGPNGALVDVTVPPLQTSAEPGAEPRATTGPREPSPVADPRAAPLRIAGFVAGGAGVVTIVVGAVFGFKSKGSHDDAVPHCDAANRCDALGVSLRADALTAGNVSTATFVAGGALLATGVTLLAIGSALKPKTPTIGLMPGRVTFKGVW
jgi:hypothetical protein